MIHTFQIFTEADSIQALLHTFVGLFNFVFEEGLTNLVDPELSSLLPELPWYWDYCCAPTCSFYSDPFEREGTDVQKAAPNKSHKH